MNKLSKRAISILVIATFMMSMIPFMPAQAVLTAVNLDVNNGQYGDTIVVYGATIDGVTSGATVEIYWDTAIGAGAQLLNSTTAEADGYWEVWFDVPEAITGPHYVWAKDTSGPFYASSSVFTVNELVELSPSSGLAGDDVDVEGYGFGEEVQTGIQIDAWAVPTESIGTGTGVIFTFAGNLDYSPSVPTTISITDTLETFTDDGVGGLSSFAGGTGVINYITGVYSVTFFVAPLNLAPITADYTRDIETIEASTSFETDELGSFIKTFDIPSFPYGTYDVSATELAGLPITAVLTIGASITVTPEEGPTGTIATIEGRGWTPTMTITFRDKAAPATAVPVVDGDVIIVSASGRFSAEVVIPVLGGLGDYDIEALESTTTAVSDNDFELTGLPEVEVSPTYGTPGASITVTGSNFTQISGVEVTITLSTIPTFELVIAETNSDGTFEDTFMSPAVLFGTYDVDAVDEYTIATDDTFKVGLIALIINPTSGQAGTKTSLTGIGFETGDYNVTFGTKLYEDFSTVSGGGAISDPFWVPNVEPGTYYLSIVDSEENELSAMFTVTAVTEVDLDPDMAPNTYNMSIDGYNFADYVYDVEFVLYNASDEWDMDVWQNAAGDDPVETDDDGNFTAWWKVLDEDDLSIGEYTINVTGYDDFIIQVNFSVVEARVDVAPRKALFDRGDTIQFNVNNDFFFDESYMKIWDPLDNLYWKTELFEDWVESGELYTVPYYLQTSGMNPMTLMQDAPMGTWFYIFYEKGTTELINGTFEVGPSSAAQIDAMLEDVRSDLSGLTDDVADLGGDFDALSDEIGGVSDDMDTLRDEIVSDLAGDIADATDAANAAGDAVDDLEGALGDLGDSVGDIADTANDALDAATAAAEAADTAASASEEARQSASGLTTLVYGAIGASLIAALAAIVSLMQISKRIAG